MPTPRPTAPKEPTKLDLGELAVHYAPLLVKLGGLGFIVCLAYFLYAIYGGVLQSADPGRAYVLISSFGKGLTISAFVLALGLIALTLEEVSYAIIVGIGGLAIMLGIPYLVASNLSQQLTGPQLQQVAQELSKSGTNAGIAVLLIVGIRVLYEIGVQIKEAPARRQARLEKEAAESGGLLKRQKSQRATHVLSRCWELPFCHERIREICPAFKQRKTCWRYGIGCNCDPKLIETLVRMGGTGGGPKTPEMKRREGAYIRSDLEADIKPLSKAQRTIPCSKCAIFNEHQRLKFKFVNPVAIVATIIIMAAAYKPITDAWLLVAGAIVQVATNITLRSNFDAGEWFEYLKDPVVQVFFFIIVSLLVLSYTLKITEWVVLEKKL